jgi:CRP-like cAMP-binding protein
MPPESSPVEPNIVLPTSPVPGGLPPRPFESGEVIYREGEPGDEAYLLEDGMVRLIKKIRGTDRSLGMLRPGDIFGESALVSARQRTQTAVAMSAGIARRFTRENLVGLLATDTEAAAGIIQQLARRLADAEDQVEIMMLSDTQSKVVSALLKLSVHARADGPGAFFTLSPMELSARIGLDIDTVKRVVHQLREGQYLRVTDSRLEVPDVDALRRLYALLGTKDELRTET